MKQVSVVIPAFVFRVFENPNIYLSITGISILSAATKEAAPQDQ